MTFCALQERPAIQFHLSWILGVVRVWRRARAYLPTLGVRN